MYMYRHTQSHELYVHRLAHIDLYNFVTNKLFKLVIIIIILLSSLLYITICYVIFYVYSDIIMIAINMYTQSHN